ncbi:hypothetical protein [Flammeovirga aprica]|uniref:Uncharacterized protein n=1 Tax=Flammeovirga aprica JL-4 TaxID=694437 RepID=A0A7X9P2X2_9BACT|nr:hypothetical protein [Flammeovirga aprica]NME68002.1 hypothetical protein [Flammeovirga aprica JL-4]
MKNNSRLIIILSSIVILIFLEGKNLQDSFGWGIEEQNTVLEEWFSSEEKDLFLENEVTLRNSY